MIKWLNNLHKTMGFVQQREIKFRDFDFETNTIRYFNLDSYDKNNHDCYGNVTQFTGFKDKNGVDIYEGDIMSWNHNTNIEVVFDKGKFLAKFQSTNDTNIWVNLENQSVIGNVYEKPELLR